MGFTSFPFQIEVCLCIEEKNIILDHFEQDLCCFFFGREFDHELTTAVGNLVLIQRIKSLLAFLANIDEVCIAQNGKVVGNGGLGDFHLFDDLINRKPAATALAHDLLAGVVGDGFRKEDGIEFHNDYKAYYIDVYLFVKREMLLFLVHPSAIRDTTVSGKFHHRHTIAAAGGGLFHCNINNLTGCKF
jgi:hypothetical protein